LRSWSPRAETGRSGCAFRSAGTIQDRLEPLHAGDMKSPYTPATNAANDVGRPGLLAIRAASAARSGRSNGDRLSTITCIARSRGPNVHERSFYRCIIRQSIYPYAYANRGKHGQNNRPNDPTSSAFHGVQNTAIPL
jgi:hypothetical protein